MNRKLKNKKMERLEICCYDKDYSIIKFGLFNYLIIKDKAIVGYAMSLKKCKKIIDKSKENKKMIYGNLPWFIVGD